MHYCKHTPQPRPPAKAMDEPPPVPPKDTPPDPPSKEETLLLRASSASKRKRIVPKLSDYNHTEDQKEGIDPDAHTPKRIRHDHRHHEPEPSDDDPSTAERRSVRRKKGFRSLSHLNLRHAAQKQAEPKGKARESKFQEGSLTDKHSEEPPSAYTRLIRTNSGTVEHVDVLMEDYHNQMEGAPDPAADHEKSKTTMEPTKQSEGGGFFRFGKHWTQSFHPVALWNKMWNESKEKLAREDAEAAERKAKQKMEAEAKYAEMKQAGQFRPQPIGPVQSDIHAFPANLATPRDSGVSMDSSKQSASSHMRSASAASDLSEFNGYSGNELPDNAGKTLRAFRSRLHLKTPSFSDFKSGLRRFGSEINLGAAAAASGSQHDSSSSVSPVKGDFDGSIVRRSQSRYDLKKQQKLTKRVSDLETKLHHARLELDEALVDASPLPGSTSRFERYIPSGTLKRHNFMPGKLPSLPSESLMPAGSTAARDFSTQNHAVGEARAHGTLSPPLHIAEFDPQFDDEDETIKARTYQIRPRLSSLFKSNIVPEPTVKADLSSKSEGFERAEPEKHDSANMDPNSIMSADNAATEPIQPKGDYNTLDAKLKALEKNAKLATKKPKKRKSAGYDDDDKPFKPDKDIDDDGESNDADSTPRKKRKAGGTEKGGKSQLKGTGDSPQEVRSKKGKKQSPPKATRPKAGSLLEVPSSAVTAQQAPALKADNESGAAHGSAVQHDIVESEEGARTSLDSQPLEPLIEEDEEAATEINTVTIQVPVKNEPSKPTAKATPARHSRGFASEVPGEDQNDESKLSMVSHKADSCESTPALQTSTGKGKGELDALGSDDEQAIVLVPGERGVPHLPKGATGSFESLAETERVGMEVEVIKAGETDKRIGVKAEQTWDWPDDVF